MKLTVDALNHLLRQNSWASELLRPHQGRVVRIALPPLAQSLAIDAGGGFTAAPVDALADATISLSPGAAIRHLLQPGSGAGQARLDGDMDLAVTVGKVLQGLVWDVEEDLSHIVGDIPAYQITQAGQRIRRELGHKFESSASMLAEYWLEEAPLIAKGRHLEQFATEVDRLRDDAARLQQRLELLEQKHR